MKYIEQKRDNSFVYSAKRTPIAYVKPNEIVTIRLLDTFGNKLKNKASLNNLRKNLNPLIGPIYVDGAKRGDTLQVHLLKITPTRNWAVSILDPNLSGFLKDCLDIPDKKLAWFYTYERGKYIYNEKLRFPANLFIGSIATAPEKKEIPSLNGFKNGGNMDVPVTKANNIVHLPVSVDGAYFYIGDCHAAQGEGELSGFALEIAADVTLKFSLSKGKEIDGPRVESETNLITIGNGETMEEASRTAYRLLIDWMKEYRWDELEAYQALTQVGELRVGNLVNPTYSMYAKIHKQYL